MESCTSRRRDGTTKAEENAGGAQKEDDDKEQMENADRMKRSRKEQEGTPEEPAQRRNKRFQETEPRTQVDILVALQHSALKFSEWARSPAPRGDREQIVRLFHRLHRYAREQDKTRNVINGAADCPPRPLIEISALQGT
ncbi:hypothetical protein NDU88_008172 [Pleurodeles waltl]|uniref:Uncharacterized protein n=1 Tax=Pleurodeles waltl TaxID=8319 RepID=A0AAV7N473_PLEWA|nr:hypothetical protein NDU88_008172 [Pleurodeles waltl]